MHAVDCGPRNYEDGAKIDVFVNKVGPYANIHETYHYYQLPLCRPQKIVHKSLSLGQVLDGDRMAESAFLVKFGQSIPTQSLCGEQHIPEEESRKLIEAIEEDYYFELIIDDLKVRNFIGYVTEAKVFPHEHNVFIYTHFAYYITANKDSVLDIALVMDSAQELHHEQPVLLNLKYSVHWNATELPISSRTKEGAVHFSNRTMRIHWLSVLNSALLVCLLVLLVSIIIFSSVKRDLSKYNTEEDGDLLLDNGWKTIGMDVFRFPSHPMLLSAIIGVGLQFLVIGACILVIGSLNLMNVHRHGLLNTLSVVLYALTSCIAGYASSSKYRQFQGKNWIANINLTSFLFAGPMIFAWSINNSVSWAYQSTQALPWTTVLVVLGIWLVFGYPLTIIGGILGRGLNSKYSAPCRTRTVPRQLPPLSCLYSTPVFSAIGGFLPFSAICVELYYIFSTMWGRESYTLFYMVLIVFVLTIIVVACCAVALTYFQLNLEDYRWWWRSVFLGGSVGVFVFCYGIYFLYYRSEMKGLVQLTEFFTHLFLLCYVTFLSMGTISHWASHKFIVYIFSSVKSD
ncbi:unnamed protein product [Auanema sp. JU1783]|nr:unnamed protein product [Auanema sp. JU1783]